MSGIGGPMCFRKFSLSHLPLLLCVCVCERETVCVRITTHLPESPPCVCEARGRDRGTCELSRPRRGIRNGGVSGQTNRRPRPQLSPAGTTPRNLLEAEGVSERWGRCRGG